jgi:2-isopropylmalate synthase
MHVELYDTTLRDGAQQEGVSFSLPDKVKIARELDALGIHYVEGGWPGSNPKDAGFFQIMREDPLAHAVVTAFGSTRRAALSAENDPNLQALIACGAPAVALVGKSSDLHAREVLGVSLEENLRMIADSVAYMVAQGKQVFFDAEHFFDGYAANPDYALRTLEAAADAGACLLVLCDTNGGMMPRELIDGIQAVQRLTTTPLGIHCHNDAGLAVANTLLAVEAGVVHVQGTINGYGERTGNANLCTLIPNLKLKLGFDCVTDEQLRGLAGLSYMVSEFANLSPNPNQPYVGRSAFAHKGGTHVNALAKCPESYQHIDPGLVGNSQRVIVSELSGKSNIEHKINEFRLAWTPSREQTQMVLREVKAQEGRGFQFEGAEGSVELLLQRTREDYKRPFKLVDFHVLVSTGRDGGMSSEATVKVRVNDELIHTAADGNGPVNALDKAVRKALLPFFPKLAGVHLTDYKVRILDGDSATGAQTRVLISSSDGHKSWTTVGSSANIIEASWMALADSLEYALLNGAGPGGQSA